VKQELKAYKNDKDNSTKAHLQTLEFLSPPQHCTVSICSNLVATRLLSSEHWGYIKIASRQHPLVWKVVGPRERETTGFIGAILGESQSKERGLNVNAPIKSSVPTKKPTPLGAVLGGCFA
jgi:hypothetical protein